MHITSYAKDGDDILLNGFGKSKWTAENSSETDSGFNNSFFNAFQYGEGKKAILQ